MGTAYAIDFIGVDERGRTAPWSWRAALSTEDPERFVGFGRSLLAPCAGRVVAAHDGEVDHEARRSQLALVPYMLGQAKRVRQGVPAIAGNHVVLAMSEVGPFILLAHLRSGSIQVAVGDQVGEGEVLGECGNSGNSTQPHVHVQATDSMDWDRAQGLPLRFLRFTGEDPCLPKESEIVDVPSSPNRGHA
jgi:murein DD-endopeptidase MepM/ murein hydrolase activator NlpD